VRDEGRGTPRPARAALIVARVRGLLAQDPDSAFEDFALLADYPVMLSATLTAAFHGERERRGGR
jgi:hypothetical protein